MSLIGAIRAYLSSPLHFSEFLNYSTLNIFCLCNEIKYILKVITLEEKHSASTRRSGSLPRGTEPAQELLSSWAVSTWVSLPWSRSLGFRHN